MQRDLSVYPNRNLNVTRSLSEVIFVVDRSIDRPTAFYQREQCLVVDGATIDDSVSSIAVNPCYRKVSLRVRYNATCIESSLCSTLSRLLRTFRHARTHVYYAHVTHVCMRLSRLSIFRVIPVGCCWRLPSYFPFLSPRHQTLVQCAGVSEAVLQATPNDCHHLRVTPHYAVASLAPTSPRNKG